jgi:hypothetical protein
MADVDVETAREARTATKASNSAPWFILGVLLILCAFHGLHLVAGLIRTPDPDHARDAGFIQGFLDGNWFGDPAYAREWRYYPPLVPALGAFLVRILGAKDVLAFWVQAGVWLNLLTPLTFYFMAKRLLGSSQAAAASTTVYVFNGAVSRPWMTGGYTPWPYIPSISQAFFFASVWIILVRGIPGMTWKKLLSAVMIGVMIGLALLAHLIPAVILTGIVISVAFGTGGFRTGTLIWLAVVGVAELATAAPYLAPILINYPTGVVNTPNVDWVDPLMFLSPFAVGKIILLNLPGIAAFAWLLLLGRRLVPPLNHASLLTLLSWIAVCSVAITRYYVCGLVEHLVGFGFLGVCKTFYLQVFYYHLYLQDAWACLIGFIVWQAMRRIWDRWRKFAAVRTLAVVLVGALLAVGGLAFLHRRFDIAARSEALTDGKIIDLEAYRWILANTVPNDLFVTDLGWSAAPFSVMAAGRQLAAVPILFSNPFVDWNKKNDLRLRYLEAAGDPDRPRTALCDLGRDHGWLLLPNDFQVVQARVEPVFRTRYNTVYRITGSDCA